MERTRFRAMITLLPMSSLMRWTPPTLQVLQLRRRASSLWTRMTWSMDATAAVCTARQNPWPGRKQKLMDRTIGMAQVERSML